MGRELVLHIGITKTGSTSIQSALAEHRDALVEQGVYIPSSPGKFAHTLLVAAAIKDRRELRKFASRHFGGMAPGHRIELFQKEFRAEMERLPGTVNKCIITSELLSERLFLDEEIDRLGALLLPHFSSARVIVYLRRQDQHAASNYSQFLRSGMNVAPGLDEPWAVNARMLDFDQLLARYATVFGTASIVPRVFAREDLVHGNIIDDFAFAAGLTMPAGLPVETNQGLSWEGQQILRAAIRMLENGAEPAAWQESSPWMQMALSISKSLPGGGWRPTRKEAEIFLARFSDGNERVRAQYFPDRSSLFDMNLTKLPDSPMTEDPAAALAACTAALFANVKDMAEREVASCMAQYRLFKRLDDNAGMRASLKRAIFLEPTHLNAHLLMATHCLQDDDFDQARGHAETALKLAPDSEYAQSLLNRLAQRTGRSKQDHRGDDALREFQPKADAKAVLSAISQSQD